MEDMNDKSCPKMPLFPNKPPISPRSITMMCPSTFSSPTGSFAMQNKHYFMNQGVTKNGRINRCPKPPHGKSCPPSVDMKDKMAISNPPLDDQNSTGVTIASENIGAIPTKTKHPFDPNMDPKKIKLILSNRVSAQKSRMKKVQHINALQTKVKDVENKIAMEYSPQITYHVQLSEQLRMEKIVLQRKMDEWTKIYNFFSVEIEKNREEIKKLKELYMMQKQHEEMMLKWNSKLGQTSNPISLNDQYSGPGKMVVMNTGNEELDQTLSFKSLTIDPPQSLI